MSCEVVNKIGTGDCKLGKNYKGEQTIANTVATELVADILENAFDIVEDCVERKPSTKVVGDILESLSNKFQELVISEEETQMADKKEIKYYTASPLKGLGDQLEAEREIVASGSSYKFPPVEKKNRLTDLVKNSKQILAKFMLSESKDLNCDEPSEKVMRVVELDSAAPPYSTKRKTVHENIPENVPLPRSDSNEILNQPDGDDKMDEIELQEPTEISVKNVDDAYKKTMTFPLSGTSGKTLSLAARYRTLKFPGELKKKKWNIGSKIINYIRKHQPKRDESKGKKKSAVNGVENTSKSDNASNAKSV